MPRSVVSPGTTALCRACDRVRFIRARGLCAVCWRKPDVRATVPRQTTGTQKVVFTTCLHCPTGKACRPRGLCTLCYDDLEIRRKYPTKGNKFGCRSEAASVTSVRPAESPTLARPKTADKIAVMAERVRLKQSLFHPDDAKA